MNILLFSHYYLPGYKAGGALRTVANMVEAIGDEYKFYIVSTDRDFGDNYQYSGIKTEQWLSVGKAKVKYYPPDGFTLPKLHSLLKENKWDLIYLQSFWDVTFSILPIWVNRKQKINIPVLLAPRGEFGTGAMKIKPVKKKVYLLGAQLICFYNNIYFHSSSDDEKSDILKIFPNSNKIFVALDFPEKHMVEQPIRKTYNKEIQICYLSRIVPKKNLFYALKILQNINVPVSFDIIGPLEDQDYWVKCKTIIDMMPDFVHVKYIGALSHEQVMSVLSKYDLFFFPTMNENFGHVIYEALQAGLPVLTSDQTPWHELEKRNAGWEVPLIEKESYIKIIEEYSRMTNDEKQKMSKAAFQYGLSVKDDIKILEDNKNMFNFFIKNNNHFQIVK